MIRTSRSIALRSRALGVLGVLGVLAGLAGLAGCGVDSTVSRTLGARCDNADECDDRCLAPGTEFPGGFCSLSCEATADCPGGASCADVDAGVCLFECDADLRCEFLGDGWRCLEVPLRGRSAERVKVCLGG